ncbi:MAG: hypothetical protein J0H07_31755 [Sphingobacteriales bacterium]|nr:hypothetical protein [Sphingobacteriales bacterium]
MLQNRVDPFGNIIRTPARGAWMGNRGVIHDEHKTIRRAFKIKAWITCVLQFKGRHREVMTPNRWTELFFLDEATAFAAGHRPCFECRREDAVRFKSCWTKGNPEYGFSVKTPIGEIDKILHGERIDACGQKVTYEALLQELPDGTFIELEGRAWLVANGHVHGWTPFGYEKGRALPSGQRVKVLTPRSVVNAFRAGYIVQINDRSAEAPVAGTPSN